MHQDLFSFFQVLFALAVGAILTWTVYLCPVRWIRLVTAGVASALLLVVLCLGSGHVFWVQRTFAESWFREPALIAATVGPVGLFVSIIHCGLTRLIVAWRGGSLVACLAVTTVVGIAGFFIPAIIPWGEFQVGLPQWLFYPVWILPGVIAGFFTAWVTNRSPSPALA